MPLFSQGITRRNRRYLFVYSTVILCICILLVVVTTLFCIKTVMRLDAERKMESYSLYLDSYVRSTESIVELTVTNLINEAHNSMALVSYTYRKVDNNVIPSTATNRALLDLSSMTDRNSSIISETIFYIPRMDVILTSTGNYGSLSGKQNDYRAMVEVYGGISADNDGIRLFRSGQNFIISYDMIPYENTSQAVLFMRLDLAKLGDYLDDIYGDAIGNVSVSAFYSDSAPVWPTKQTQSPEGAGSEKISKVSDRLGWTFTLSVSGLSSPDILEAIPQLGMFTIIVVFTFSLISIAAAIFLLRPVFSLTHAIENTGLTSEGEKSYIDAIQNISSRQRELDNTLQIVAHEVLTNLFSDLLNGRAKSYDTIRTLLSGIKSDFRTTALYTAIAIQSNADIHKQVESFFDQFNTYNDTATVLVDMEPNLLAVVLQFSKTDISIKEAKSKLRQIEEGLKARFNDQNHDVSVSSGYLCHSIMDISFSYSKAVSQEEERGESINMAQRIEFSIDSLLQGDSETSANHIGRIIQIETESDDPNAVATKLLNVLKSFSDEFCIRTDTELEKLNPYTERFSAGAAGCHDKEEVLKLFEEVRQDMFTFCEDIVRRRNNPYILKARQHIEEHYRSTNLSLVSIADAIGISPSYLSKLFSEQLGIKLIDYVSQVRVSKSMSDLTRSDVPIFEIASKCGFSSSRNYIAAFRKQYGTTPGEYRRNNRIKR